MAVEITGVPGASTNIKHAEQTRPSTAESTSSGSNANAATPSTDSFTVSQQAERLRLIESNINTQPDVDGARVESLKSAIDAGQYDIDPRRVAEKLIELEAQFVA